MKLREAIENIHDEDWLDLTEEPRRNYRTFLGRAPKYLIHGEVLDYEVVSIKRIQHSTDYTLHRFIVKEIQYP